MAPLKHVVAVAGNSVVLSAGFGDPWLGTLFLAIPKWVRGDLDLPSTPGPHRRRSWTLDRLGKGEQRVAQPAAQLSSVGEDKPLI